MEYTRLYICLKSAETFSLPLGEAPRPGIGGQDGIDEGGLKEAFAAAMPSKRRYPRRLRTTAPLFCSIQAWSFLRWGRERVSSNPMTQAVVDHFIVHKFAAVVDIQRAKGKGQTEADTLERLDRQRAVAHPRGATSVQPLATSVKTRLLM